MNHLIMFNTRFSWKPLLLCTLLLSGIFYRAFAQDLDGGSRFVQGFARVQQGSDYYYIDSTGKRAFDRILDRDGHAFDVLPAADDDGIIPGTDTAEGRLPEYFKLVSLGKKQGVLLVSGKWMLRPEYDSIDTQYQGAWTVTNNGKSTQYKATGFALPFLFDTVDELDGNYFIVKQDGKWGIYDKRAEKLSVPCEYEDMDYCFGCESKGDYAFAQKNGKWGVISFQDEILLPFEYDHRHANMRSDEWVECLYKDDKPLLINLRTKSVTEDTCGCLGNDERVPLLVDGFRSVQQGELYGLVNADGKKVLSTQYESIRYDGISLPRPLVQISQHGKSGLADTSGHIIIQPLYDNYFRMINDTLLTVARGNKLYLFNMKGQPVLQGAYDDIRPWRPVDSDTTTAFLKLVRGELMGFYNLHTGKLVAPQYSYIYDTDTSRKYCLMVEKNGRQGVIDTSGTVIIPPRFDDIQFLPHGFPNQVQVAINYKYGIYDYGKNLVVIPPRYDNITPVELHGLYLVQRDNNETAGLLDLEGKVAYPVLSRQQLDQADSLANYFVISRRDSLSEKVHYTVFNSHTRERYALPYDTVLPGGYKDRVGVHVGKRQYALFDLAARKAIEGAYSRDGLPQFVYPYQDKAVVMKNDKIGIIDTAGNFKTPPVYDMLYPVVENVYLFVQRDANGVEHYGYGDSTTRLFVPMEYDFQRGDREEYLRDSLLLLLKKDPDGTMLKGFAGLDGKIVIPAKYESIRATKNKQFFLVKAGEQFGILRRNGAVVLPVAFEEILLDDNTLYFEDAAFSFPVMAKKNGTWAYYDAEGKALPLRMKATIDYLPVEEVGEPAAAVVPPDPGH